MDRSCENCGQQRCWCEVILVAVDHPASSDKYSAWSGHQFFQAPSIDALKERITAAIGKKFRLNLPTGDLK